jgi:bifunctional non-homologous end joining protein LigD
MPTKRGSTRKATTAKRPTRKKAVAKRAATKAATKKQSPTKKKTPSKKAAAAGPAAALAEYRRKRDFSRTREPAGGKAAAGTHLAYIIQKHAASHLHFDLRLELDGVMKSWAVPKGPSLDPTVKRLAMQVEDHPIEYNKFEGTIPAGEYGGGTVMLWDRGTYTAPGGGADAEDVLRRGYEKGDFKFELHGKRLHGSWVLVRIRRDEERRQWLLIKHRDEYAEEGADIVADVTTSVATGRTMDEIAGA